MGCGAQPKDPVLQAKIAEQTRQAPLLMRMEKIVNLHREGLMSQGEFEAHRAALAAEIAGNSVGTEPVSVMVAPSTVSLREERIRRSEAFRKRVEEMSRQMKDAPDRLPDDYYAFLESLQPKFTKEVAENDEWKHATKGPMQEYYNSTAGRTIEEILADKSTLLDSHNNPVGTQYDLPRDGTMQEHTLVLCWFADEGTYSKPVNALREKGFKVIVHNSRDSTVQQMMVSLLGADVVWLVSGKSIVETAVGQLIDALTAFHYRGGGIFVWGDNAPYFAHANLLLSSVFPHDDVYLEGNDEGGQIMRAHTDGLTPGHLTKQHLIMTGLNSLFEGVTISYLKNNGPLKILATYNHGRGYSGKPYCAVADGEVYRRCRTPYKIGRGRIVIDGGFTKLYDEHWGKTAGTGRYVLNASTWLLNMNSRILSDTQDSVNNNLEPVLRTPSSLRGPRQAQKTYRVGPEYR